MSFRELTKAESAAMTAGACMMVAGVLVVMADIGGVLPPAIHIAAVIFYVVGTMAFAAMQVRQTYNGANLVVKRLRRTIILSDVCFVASGLLLFEQTFHIVKPLFAVSIEGYNAYCNYVQNNWGVLMLIATVLELYGTMRISYELKKEK